MTVRRLGAPALLEPDYQDAFARRHLDPVCIGLPGRAHAWGSQRARRSGGRVAAPTADGDGFQRVEMKGTPSAP